MANGFNSTVNGFMAVPPAAVIGSLAESVAETGVSSERTEQIRAWKAETTILRQVFDRLLRHSPECGNWGILLEYELPRRQKRPDVIILAKNTVIVLEFKVNGSAYDNAARWQVHHYGLNLRDFHAASRNLRVIPILCATDAKPISGANIQFTNRIAETLCANEVTLHDMLQKIHVYSQQQSGQQINTQQWANSPYHPTPTIVEAAERLYHNHDVRNISHAYAANLTQTTDILASVARRARDSGSHFICFVTGVPGAGKTLTGLNLVHDPKVRAEGGASGIFLSGNGPLVRVIREALVMSLVDQGSTRKQSEHEVSTFIQSVHTFLRYYRENPRLLPHEHLVIFDEAQRAWDEHQMRIKQKIPVSEPAELLDVMGRFEDWSVIVALVGGGQEIFRGEAGLEEWGRAIKNSDTDWKIVASPEVLHGGSSVAGHSLFSDGDIPTACIPEPSAHLGLSVRSHRAQRFADWVNYVLAGEPRQAARHIPCLSEFPMAFTRDLSRARDWLKLHLTDTKEQRCGLVMSSGDPRIRAYGLENSSGFLRDFRFDKWFLSGPEDVRSSYRLEVAASEFECQGLELDWVGVCWGGDLLPRAGGWTARKFRGTSWQYVRKSRDQQYCLNRYRVLLTRARSGMVIWVPRGSEDDDTRQPDWFDSIAEVLSDSGLPAI